MPSLRTSLRFANPTVLLWLLGLVIPVLVPAQVNVTVDATQGVRTVDERVFGANSVIWDGKAGDSQTISLLQAAGLRMVRIPGGSLSDAYDWSTNRGISQDPQTKVWTVNNWHWFAGFDSFAGLFSGIGAQAIVTVNYGSGTPQEAAAWVAYANSAVGLLGTGADIPIGIDSVGADWKTAGYWSAMRNADKLAQDDDHNFLRMKRAAPFGIRYWEIGNECYGTWEVDRQGESAQRPGSPHDPTTYANRAGDYLTKMKAVDPTIKVGVVVVTGGNNSGENANYKNWTPVMLARLKVLNVTPDFVIYHRYPQGPGNESDATLLQDAGTWAGTAANIRQQLTTYLGAAGAGVEIIVTENNSVYSDPGKQSTSLVNGLYLADSIASVMKTEINAFMWWAVRNGTPTSNGSIVGNMSPSLYGWRSYGDYGMISSPVTGGATSSYEPYPTYYAMKLLQYFARGGDTVVAATSGSSLLSVGAVKRANGALNLLVINKDPVNTLSANIALTGFTPGTTATVYSYGKPQDDAAKPGGSGLTDIATSVMNITGANFTASFASYSVTVLSLNAAPLATAPIVTVQPIKIYPQAGQTRTYNIEATGSPAPSYQWQRLPLNGTWGNLTNTGHYSGVTSDTLTIANVSLDLDGDEYRCIASNSAGSVGSNPAGLTLVTHTSGDFDLDEKPDLVWQNSATGARRVWLMNGTTQSSEVPLTIATADWSIAGAGDFNYDHKQDLVLQNPGTGERGICLMHGTNAIGFVSLGIVPTEWNIGGVGKFSYDVHDDIIWENTLTGERGLWIMSLTTLSSWVPLGTLAIQWNVAGTGYFNADNQTDIVWQNTLTGERKVWLMNGTTKSSEVSLGYVALQWSIGAVADYNGDNKPDIYFQNTLTGERAIWLMNGTTLTGYAFPPTESTDWVIGRIPSRPAAADFDHDGKPDVVWQNTSTGDRKVWLMNGTVFGSEVSFGAVGLSWQIAGTGDLDGDGRCDILWQNTSTGERGVWLMLGTNLSGFVPLGTIPTDWQMVGTSDFNNDNRTDIVWQNTSTGERGIWLMAGTTLSGWVSLGNVSTVWQIAGVADFNRDDHPDLLWQNTSTGERKVWYMAGTTFTSEASFGTVALPWSMVGTGDYNLDGSTDIVWQNTSTGEIGIWLLNGTALSGYVDLGTQPLIWQIAN